MWLTEPFRRGTPSMITRIRKSIEEKDEGFTLIELLVVIIIIGILAAIAIPVFLNQRKKAVEASMKSDLRTAATLMETDFVDTQDYGSATAAAAVAAAAFSADNAVTVTSADTSSFCLDVTTARPYDNDWSYDSSAGGLLQGTC